jgi:hypothetical protein
MYGVSSAHNSEYSNTLMAEVVLEEINTTGNATHETWALILREEHRLRVFQKRVLGEYLD